MIPLESPLMLAAPQTRYAVANGPTDATTVLADFGQVWSQFAETGGEDSTDHRDEADGGVIEGDPSTDIRAEEDALLPEMALPAAPIHKESPSVAFGLGAKSPHVASEAERGAAASPIGSPPIEGDILSSSEFGSKTGSATAIQSAVSGAALAVGQTGSGATQPAQPATPGLTGEATGLTRQTSPTVTGGSTSAPPLAASGPLGQLPSNPTASFQIGGAVQSPTTSAALPTSAPQPDRATLPDTQPASPQMGYGAPSERRIAPLLTPVAQPAPSQSAGRTPAMPILPPMNDGGVVTLPDALSLIGVDARQSILKRTPPDNAQMTAPSGVKLAVRSGASAPIATLATPAPAPAEATLAASQDVGALEALLDAPDALGLSTPVGSANAAAATPTQPMPPAAPASVAQQIASALTQTSGRTTEITLNPEELGRVRISLTTTEAGMTVSILSERPETTDLMRRHIDVLANEFAELGYDSLSFSFDGGDGEAGEGTPQDDAATVAEADLTLPAEPQQLTALSASLTGGLDLKL